MEKIMKIKTNTETILKLVQELNDEAMIPKKYTSLMQFHSRAKSLPKDGIFSTSAMRDLSNFAEFDVEYQGIVFPTAEHAFQAQKYSCTKKPELMDVIRNLKTPQEAKSAGSKTGMRKNGVVLDIACWNNKKMEVMRGIIKSKYDRHKQIRDIVKTARKHNIELVHFSRTDMEWGAHVNKDTGKIKEGQNKLGKIYNEIE